MMDVIVGISQRAYPSFSFGEVVLTAVLTRGVVGDHACYLGHGEPDFVAIRGQKLTYEEARRFFPGLSAKEYRE